MKSSLVNVFRQNAEDKRLIEVKDPAIVPMPDGSYMLYATVFGPGISREDIIGRFHASHPQGPWHQLESARVHGVTGPEVCAPQVLLSEENGQLLWTMYVQTSCFEQDGHIAVAVSRDGKDFYALPTPAMTRHAINQHSVVCLYDVSVSDIHLKGKPYECMVFSGYRHFNPVAAGHDTLETGIMSSITQNGCGDLYMSLREKDGFSSEWSTPKLILKQEDVPFHNHPASPNFEWGLEGGKIIQLEEDSFLLTGVCFLEKDIALRGTRQRVFFATAASPAGPFVSHTLPLEPTPYDVGQGENGHPDVIDLGSRLAILYQERAGVGHPWHLRYAEISKKEVQALLSPPAPVLAAA